MTPLATVPASASLLLQLANPAARALALAVAAGLGLAAFRVRSTSVRLFTWKSVLFAALAMPLLGSILPPLSIPTPAFLQNALTTVRGSERSSAAAERSQNAAHGVSRAESAVTSQPQRGDRYTLKQEPNLIGARVNASSLTTAAPIPLAPVAASVPSPSPSIWASLEWRTLAAALYLAVASLLLARFFIGLAFTRRLLRQSHTIADPRLTQKLASRARASGMSVIPHAAESEFISVPVTLGALRSTILLPAAWREWDDPQLDAVIAHELSHVARRDALTQRLSLLHRAIFWFSPLVWWLDRHLANLAEQASDEAALSGGADRNHYAQILLGFFEALQASPGRVWWQGVSMAKAGQAEQRLERILSWKGSVAMHLKKSIAVAVIALSVPVIYLAASARPAVFMVSPLHVDISQDQTPPPAPATADKSADKTAPPPAPASEMIPPPAEPTLAPDAAPAPAAITGTIDGVPGDAAPAIAPVPPVRPIAGVPSPAAPVAGVYPRIYPPRPAIAPRAAMAVMSRSQSSGSGSSGSGSSHSSGRGFSYRYGYDDDQRFVIVSGKTDSSTTSGSGHVGQIQDDFVFTMSGSGEDARHVEKLRKQIQGDFIWFQRDEKSYVIRDQATVDRARKFWEPQKELDKKQEALGKQQEALGKQQEELGNRMEQVQVNVPDMTAALDSLKAKLQKLGSHATMDQIGDLQSEIGELQSKIGEIQSQAGEQQSKLGEQQGALGEKQGKLGEQQGELGNQQAELAHQANLQMKKLLDESIKNGLAQPEP